MTGTAFMMGRGMEHWHPDPGFYYQPGAGPVMDMGPYYLTMLVNLMGPVRRVQAVATSGQAERLITAEGPEARHPVQGRHADQRPVAARVRRGATVTFGASWDVFRHSNPPIELHGTEGLAAPARSRHFRRRRRALRRGAPSGTRPTPPTLPYGAPNWPVDAPDRANYRMLGLADLGRALIEGRPPRASGDLALHVLEVMEAILRAGETGTAQIISGTITQPSELGEDEARRLMA